VAVSSEHGNGALGFIKGGTNWGITNTTGRNLLYGAS